MNELPIVLSLQAACLDEGQPVSALLRKAKVIAFKLDLEEFRQWVEAELNGYGDAETDKLPPYRQIKGMPQAENPIRGWQQIASHSEAITHALSLAPTGQSIAELEDLLRQGGDDGIAMPVTGKRLAAIQRAISATLPVRVSIGINQIRGLVDAVRNVLLHWTLELERAGVLGEGLRFSNAEKSAAAPVTNVFLGEAQIGVLGHASGSATVNNYDS